MRVGINRTIIGVGVDKFWNYDDVECVQKRNKSSSVGVVKFQNSIVGTECASTTALGGMVRNSLATHFIFNLCSILNKHTFKYERCYNNVGVIASVSGKGRVQRYYIFFPNEIFGTFSLESIERVKTVYHFNSVIDSILIFPRVKTMENTQLNFFFWAKRDPSKNKIYKIWVSEWPQ